MPSIGTDTSRGTSPRPDNGDSAGERAAGAGQTVPCQGTRSSLSASGGGNGEHSTKALLELSDERDASLRRRLAAFREGYHAAELAHAADYSIGYVDGLLRRKHLEHDAVDAAKLYARRWELRGEPRTRETFSQPHPDDFTGRGAA